MAPADGQWPPGFAPANLTVPGVVPPNNDLGAWPPSYSPTSTVNTQLPSGWPLGTVPSTNNAGWPPGYSPNATTASTTSGWLPSDNTVSNSGWPPGYDPATGTFAGPSASTSPVGASPSSAPTAGWPPASGKPTVSALLGPWPPGYDPATGTFAPQPQPQPALPVPPTTTTTSTYYTTTTPAVGTPGWQPVSTSPAPVVPTPASGTPANVTNSVPEAPRTMSIVQERLLAQMQQQQQQQQLQPQVATLSKQPSSLALSVPQSAASSGDAPSVLTRNPSPVIVTQTTEGPQKIDVPLVGAVPAYTMPLDMAQARPPSATISRDELASQLEELVRFDVVFPTEITEILTLLR